MCRILIFGKLFSNWKREYDENESIIHKNIIAKSRLLFQVAIKIKKNYFDSLLCSVFFFSTTCYLKLLSTMTEITKSDLIIASQKNIASKKMYVRQNTIRLYRLDFLFKLQLTASWKRCWDNFQRCAAWFELVHVHTDRVATRQNSISRSSSLNSV